MSDFVGPSNDLGYASIENLSEQYLDFSSILGTPDDARKYQNLLLGEKELEDSFSRPLNDLMIRLNELLIKQIKDKIIREEIMGLVKDIGFYGALKSIRQYEHAGRFVRTEAMREAAEKESNDARALAFRVMSGYLRRTGKRPKMKDIAERVDRKRLLLGMKADCNLNALKRHFAEWRALHPMK